MTVFVGDASFAMKYVIHKKLVSYHSTFFKAALNGSFLEGQNNQVKLEEELPEVFNGFVHWLLLANHPEIQVEIHTHLLSRPFTSFACTVWPIECSLLS